MIHSSIYPISLTGIEPNTRSFTVILFRLVTVGATDMLVRDIVPLSILDPSLLGAYIFARSIGKPFIP